MKCYFYEYIYDFKWFDLFLPSCRPIFLSELLLKLFTLSYLVIEMINQTVWPITLVMCWCLIDWLGFSWSREKMLRVLFFKQSISLQRESTVGWQPGLAAVSHQAGSGLLTPSVGTPGKRAAAQRLLQEYRQEAGKIMGHFSSMHETGLLP